jgi:Uma2 family endonuclease
MHDMRAAELDQEQDHVVLLRGLTWRDYERLLRARGEDRKPRFSYLDGALELMTTSRGHERMKSFIGRLVEVYCLERDIDFTPYGGWTLKDKPKEAGAEADECYIFGADQEADRPDLAIEVMWTPRPLDKLEVYRRLGVREVWYWEAGKLQPYVLRRGRWVAVARSELLPELDLELLTQFLDHPTASAAIRDFRAALRA